MKMLIGSRALDFWGVSSRPITESTDWDIIGEPFDVPAWYKVEFHKPQEFHSEEFLKFASKESIKIGSVEVFICSLRGLAALKKSHLCIDWQFSKHMKDWEVLRWHWHAGDEDLMQKRRALQVQQAKMKTPSLKKSNEEFFDDYVKKVFVHDHLHEVVKFFEVPLYERLKKPEGFGEAWCEENLWWKLKHSERLYCILEETYVICIERYLVPSGWTVDPRWAFQQALKKVCTSLTSGWFREYALNYYPALIRLFSAKKLKDCRAVLHRERSDVVPSLEIELEVQMNKITTFVQAFAAGVMLGEVNKEGMLSGCPSVSFCDETFSCKKIIAETYNDGRACAVYSFTDNRTLETCLVKLSGSNYLHCGYNVSSWAFVQPVTKTVQAYEEIV